MTTQLQTVAARPDVASDTPGTQKPQSAWKAWTTAQEEVDRCEAGLRALFDVVRVASSLAAEPGAKEILCDATIPEVMAVATRELERLYGAAEALSAAAREGRHMRLTDLPAGLIPVRVGGDE